MASSIALQQALSLLLDAEPWDPIAVERARTKLSIAREAEDHVAKQARAELRDELALRRDEEIFQMQKVHLTQVHNLKALHGPRPRTPPPASRPISGAARSSSPASVGLDAESVSLPGRPAAIDCTMPLEDDPLLPRLVASFRTDLIQQFKTPAGSGN